MTLPISEAFDRVLAGEPGDLTSFYRRSCDENPIFWSDTNSKWIISKYNDQREILLDEETFGPVTQGVGSTGIYGRTIIHMEGTEHRRKDTMISHHLRNRKLLSSSQETYIRKLCENLIDKLPVEEPLDLKAGLCTPLPLEVIAWLIDIEEAVQLRSTYDRMVSAGSSNQSGDPEIQKDGEKAVEELFVLLRPLIEERRQNPGEDLLSTLCTAEYEEERLSETEILSFAVFLMAAGVETTDRSLSGLLRILISNPNLWTQLRNERQLLNSAIAEGLRFAPPVHAINREVRKDVTIQGQEISKGSKLLLLLGAGNRDPEIFEEPDQFRIDRFAENADAQFSANATVLSFGHDRHFCTGSLLAKLEMIEGMNILLDRFESIRWASSEPEECGYVLRSPDSLPVLLSTT